LSVERTDVDSDRSAHEDKNEGCGDECENGAAFSGNVYTRPAPLDDLFTAHRPIFGVSEGLMRP
jgi:hypothetical protein